MTKTIRKTYPRDFSIGVLIIIFTCVFFLAGQLFEKHQPNLNGYLNMYVAYFLVSLAVLIMILILWEESLFPVTIIPEGDELIFRNHRTKLKIQALIFLSIPVIITFLFLNYEVKTFRFFGWAAVCAGLPILAKLISGINNYNDFLTLTSSYIEYKNNELEGKINISEVKSIELTKDEKGLHQKLILNMKTGDPLTIDMDEMELEDFYEAIDEYISEQYKSLFR